MMGRMVAVAMVMIFALIGPAAPTLALVGIASTVAGQAVADVIDVVHRNRQR